MEMKTKRWLFGYALLGSRERKRRAGRRARTPNSRFCEVPHCLSLTSTSSSTRHRHQQHPSFLDSLLDSRPAPELSFLNSIQCKRVFAALVQQFSTSARATTKPVPAADALKNR